MALILCSRLHRPLVVGPKKGIRSDWDDPRPSRKVLLVRVPQDLHGVPYSNWRTKFLEVGVELRETADVA